MLNATFWAIFKHRVNVGVTELHANKKILEFVIF